MSISIKGHVQRERDTLGEVRRRINIVPNGTDEGHSICRYMETLAKKTLAKKTLAEKILAKKTLAKKTLAKKILATKNWEERIVTSKTVTMRSLTSGPTNSEQNRIQQSGQD